MPHIDPLVVMPVLFFAMLTGVLLFTTVGIGRSPHITYRPEQIDVGWPTWSASTSVKEEVVRTLQLFLATRASPADGRPAPPRPPLRGRPGDRQDYTAKAMAAEAGVPFLFASATSFQSTFQGATQRKIRRYFKALRKPARQDGGAIGFIDEFDAIGGAPASACRAQRCRPSVGSQPTGAAAAWPVCRPASVAGAGPAVRADRGFTGGGDPQMAVNELLVQMQSFDEPTGMQKLRAKLVDRLNLLLPPHRQLRGPSPPSTNILLIASTNRADDLDPALLRPGRFDRRLTFDLPAKTGRRQLDRPLPRPQGARPGAGRGRAARRAGRHHPGLHARR